MSCEWVLISPSWSALLVMNSWMQTSFPLRQAKVLVVRVSTISSARGKSVNAFEQKCAVGKKNDARGEIVRNVALEASW